MGHDWAAALTPTSCAQLAWAASIAFHVRPVDRIIDEDDLCSVFPKARYGLRQPQHKPRIEASSFMQGITTESTFQQPWLSS